MTDYVWPHSLLPDDTRWRLQDFTGVFTNPFGGSIRTVSRGQRWACTMNFSGVGGRETAEMAKRSQLLALVAALRGRSNRIWLSDLSSPFCGAFPCPELIADPYPVSAVTPWAASNAELVLTADRQNGLRLTRTAVAANRDARHGAVTAVSGARYAFRALFAAGKGSLNAGLQVGTTLGGSESLAGAARSASGRYVESLAAGAATIYPGLVDYIAGRSAGDFWHATGLSLSRCVRVQTTALAGSTAMVTKDWPVSTAGLCLAGDLFEVGGELHRLTANVESDSSGNGYAMFEPALRSTQATDTPVILRDPAGRFALADEAEWATRPEVLSDITLTFVEA